MWVEAAGHSPTREWISGRSSEDFRTLIDRERIISHFWLGRAPKVGDFPLSIFQHAARQRLSADDVGQRQVVGVGGDVVDALLVKGDADDLA